MLWLTALLLLWVDKMYTVQSLFDGDLEFWIVTNGEDIAAWTFPTKWDAQDYANSLNMEIETELSNL